MTSSLGGFHVHRFRYGTNLCADCGAMIVDPILTTDDPRCGRQAPGWMSEDGKLFGPFGENPPLPIVLVELWDRGVVPPAPYIEAVSNLERPRTRDEWLDIFTQYEDSRPAN